MNREQIRAEINSQPLTAYIPLTPSPDRQPNKFVCPICGSGTGNGLSAQKHKPTGALHLYPDSNRVICFAGGCFSEKGQDTLGALRTIWNCNETEVFSRCGYSTDNITVEATSKPVQTFRQKNHETIPLNQDVAENGSQSNLNGMVQNDSFSQPVKEETEAQQVYTDFLLQAHENLMDTDYHRGISLDTLNRFKVGYVENWRHPKAPASVPTSPRLIIPTSDYSYIARDTRQNLTDTEKRYSKSKVGNVHIFNSWGLWNSDKPIFIVEGEIDAMSICDVGGEAVGIGSTSMVNKFLEILKNTSRKPPQPLIIALDNDKAGQEATAKLSEGLYSLNIPYFVYNIAKPYKDANDFLLQDRNGLTEKVRNISLNPERAIYEENNVYSHLQDFLNGIADSVNTPYVSTGFSTLDSVLNGGFYEGLYILGAISSLGKTTLAMQICDNIANNGNDVLVFSLEMARSELMSKSISRLTLLDALQNGGDTRNAKSARGITTGSRYAGYSQTETELIQRAAVIYGMYAKNLYIHEGIGDIGAFQIREIVENHIRITGKNPVVLIDYLQILAPADVRATDKQNTDKAVLELKRISRDFKIPVIGISSFNRENYKTAVNYASFKESGAIEYSSDVLIGLQLKGAGDKSFDVDVAKAKNPREIELVILKNRNGETGKKIAFRYFPMFNYFEELGISQKQERL